MFPVVLPGFLLLGGLLGLLVIYLLATGPALADSPDNPLDAEGKGAYAEDTYWGEEES
jgi:hypothetical protein